MKVERLILIGVSSGTAADGVDGEKEPGRRARRERQRENPKETFPIMEEPILVTSNQGKRCFDTDILGQVISNGLSCV